MALATSRARGGQAGSQAGSRRGGTSGIVQAVAHRATDVERRRWESLTVLVVATAAYSALGYWLVVEMHVVGFETLDRFNRALMVLHDDPATLAAVGFDYPPLAVLLLAPFAVVPSLVSSLVVVPVVSALFAASILVVVNTMMRRAQVVGPLRVVVLAGLGLNPLVVLYAASGSRQLMWLAFVVAALGALFAWYVTADIRFVMLAGLAYAAAAVTGYSSLTWFVVSGVMVAAILARLGADGTEVEGTTVGFAAPTVYVVTIWTAVNLILFTDPFQWVTAGGDAAGTAGALSLLDVATGTGLLLLHGAPLAIVVLPTLLIVGIARRNGFALWLGVLLVLSVLAPGLAVLLRLTDAPLVMNNALPILLISVVGALWLVRSAVGSSTLVAGALALGLLVSIPWTFAAMSTFERQGLEKAFADAVTTGQSQEGARTLAGTVVGYDDERDMGEVVAATVSRPGSVLTDNAQTYAVMMMAGDPSLFLDRVDASDRVWRDTATDPAGRVDYLLLSTDTSADLLSRLYPTAAAGTDAALTTVHSNDRYVLVSVPDGYEYGDGDTHLGELTP